MFLHNNWSGVIGKDLPLIALLILYVWLGVATGKSADSPSHLWATKSTELIFSQFERGIVGLRSKSEWRAFFFFFERSEGKWIGIHLQELNEIKEWLGSPCAMTFTDSHAGYWIISWQTNTMTLQAHSVIYDVYSVRLDFCAFPFLLRQSWYHTGIVPHSQTVHILSYSYLL